jgi:hypothetical protein
MNAGPDMSSASLPRVGQMLVSLLVQLIFFSIYLMQHQVVMSIM